VDGDENSAALRVGHGRAVVERGIFVAEARLNYLEALRFESAADLRGEFEDHFAFAEAAGAACAGVGAAVGGVEDYGVEDVGLEIGLEIVGRLRSCRGVILRSRGRGGSGLGGHDVV